MSSCFCSASSAASVLACRSFPTWLLAAAWPAAHTTATSPRLRCLLHSSRHESGHDQGYFRCARGRAASRLCSVTTRRGTFWEGLGPAGRPCQTSRALLPTACINSQLASSTQQPPPHACGVGCAAVTACSYSHMTMQEGTTCTLLVACSLQAVVATTRAAAAAPPSSPEQIGLPRNCANHLLPPVHRRSACCPDLPQAAGTAHSCLLLLVLLLQQLPLQRLQAINKRRASVCVAPPASGHLSGVY
jgi:hypothetical protein